MNEKKGHEFLFGKKRDKKDVPEEEVVLKIDKDRIDAEPVREYEKHAVRMQGYSVKGGKGENEDRYMIDGEHGLFGVFDGIGGYAGGADAAREAVTYFQEQAETFGNDVQTVQTQLAQALKKASERVYESLPENDWNGEKKGGCTASMGKIVNGPNGERVAVLAHVGDSRIYLVRDGNVKQMTVDDGALTDMEFSKDKLLRLQRFVGDLHDPGNDLSEYRHDEDKLEKTGLEKDDLTALMLGYRMRNAVYQYLGKRDKENIGGSAELQPYVTTVPLKEGDIILATTDGIHDPLTSTEIMDALQDASPDEAAKVLCEKALKNTVRRVPRAKGYVDDTTAVVVDVKPFEDGK